MAKNPYIDSLSGSKAMFMPSGWVESPWFDGALMEMPGYLHSVYVVGRISVQSNPVEVRYKVGAETGRCWGQRPARRVTNGQGLRGGLHRAG